MAATALSGCGKKEDEKSSKVRGVDKLQKQVLEDVDKYATPGEYKGVKAEAEDVPEITDAAIEADIQGWLQYYPVAFEGSVVSGQSANIDYKGTVDGKEFEGGSAQGHQFQQVGAGTFIPGFEEQIIGMNVGDTKTVNVTFPADYPNNADLAGKEAAFEVKVNNVQGTATLNEKWIEYVAQQTGITKDELKENTPEEFKKFVKARLEEQAKNKRKASIVQQVLATVTKNTNFKDFSDDIKNKYIEDEKTYQKNSISQYGTTFEDYLKQAGITEDDFNKQVEENAIEYMKNVYALKAIASKEKIKLSEKEYEECLKSYADRYQLDSVEAFEEQYEDQYGTDLYEGALLEKVLDFIVDKAKVTEPKNASGDAVVPDGAAQ